MNNRKKGKLCCKHGFTLIEMVGVLAIMAILSAMIVPNVVKQMQGARQDVEDQTLDIMADGLVNYVLENRIIPQSGYGQGIWSGNIATQTGLPEKQIYINDAGCNRRYWFDPSTDLNGLSGGGGAYNQNTVSATNFSGYTTGLTASPPVSPRAMIISDLSTGCTQNINSVANTAQNFSAVWDQIDSATDPLVESSKLKIKRINFSQLFETVTLQSGNGSLSSRRSYTNPNSTTPQSGPPGPIIVYPLITVEKNSHIYSITYSTGGFEPTNLEGGTALLDIGYTPGGSQFVSAANVTSGVTAIPVSVNYTSTADINISSELTITGANVFNGNSGFIDTTVGYNGEPQYKLEGQSIDPTVIVISTPGIPEIISFNVINGTSLYLYDQSWTIGNPSGNMLHSSVIKESESYTYSPRPIPSWSR
jgi:prepilin-type N-terminal cleavage/methylation domain